MLKLRLAGSQRGDTIVEVMIVFAVMALAIVVAYGTANKSLQSARQAQEAAEATQLAQSQIEYARYLAGLNDPARNVYDSTADYCIYRDTAGSLKKVAATDPNCTVSSDGSRRPGSYYQVSLTYCPTGSFGAGGRCGDIAATDRDSLIAKVRWPDVDGSGTASAQLTYRMHPQ